MNTPNKFKFRCNGIFLDGAKLSPKAAQAVADIFPVVKKDFEAMMDGGYIDGVGNVYFGSRSCVSGVLDRLKGFYSEDVLTDPYGWTMDALRDCAQADYYYAFEKDWD